MADIRKPREIDRSSPPWLITYGDMATLLLVFFIFLFSVSEVKQEKFKAATGSLRAQIGIRPKRGSVVESRPPVQVRRRERREKERLGLPGRHERVLAAAQGARVVFGGRIGFERGSASCGPAAKETLRRLADELRGLPNIIEVRGHASAGEGSGEGYADDLALSLLRAANVLRFLVKDAGIDRSRLRALGAGSEEPADAGLYGDEPARDRRVEITVAREVARARADREADRARERPAEEHERPALPLPGPFDTGPRGHERVPRAERK